MKFFKKIILGVVFFAGLLTVSIYVNAAYLAPTTQTLTKPQAIRALVLGLYPDYTSLDDIISGKVEPIWDISPILNNNKLKEKTEDIRAISLDEESTAQYRMSVSTKTIQEEWLGWINYERSIQWLQPLVLDDKLNTTSIERANTLSDEQRYTTMHRRPWQSCSNAFCYDLNDWFNERGVVGAAETILYGWYNCNLQDCTHHFIETIRWRVGWPSWFLGFIYGEKPYNGVHYRMMMTPEYTKVGIWFSSSTHPGFWWSYIGVIHYQ